MPVLGRAAGSGDAVDDHAGSGRGSEGGLPLQVSVLPLESFSAPLADGVPGHAPLLVPYDPPALPAARLVVEMVGTLAPAGRAETGHEEVRRLQTTEGGLP